MTWKADDILAFFVCLHLSSSLWQDHPLSRVVSRSNEEKNESHNQHRNLYPDMQHAQLSPFVWHESDFHFTFLILFGISTQSFPRLDVRYHAFFWTCKRQLSLFISFATFAAMLFHINSNLIYFRTFIKWNFCKIYWS